MRALISRYRAHTGLLLYTAMRIYFFWTVHMTCHFIGLTIRLNIATVRSINKDRVELWFGAHFSREKSKLVFISNKINSVRYGKLLQDYFEPFLEVLQGKLVI